MSRVLKTGDVKRVPRKDFSRLEDGHEWALIYTGDDEDGRPTHWTTATRGSARSFKIREDRIARVLSIGPKLVTVRIEK